MAAYKWPTDGQDNPEKKPDAKPAESRTEPDTKFTVDLNDLDNIDERVVLAIQERMGNAAADKNLFLRGIAAANGAGGSTQVGGLDFKYLKVPELVRSYGVDRLTLDLTTARGFHNQDPYVQALRKECLGAFLRKVIDPRSSIADCLPRDIPETVVRVLSSSNSAGGYLVPPGYIPDLTQDIEKESELYPYVRKYPVSEPAGTMPTVGTNATVSWGSENTSIDEGDPSFGETTWSVSRLNVLLKLSREIANDTNPAIVDVVTQLFRESMARELDRVIAIGTGSGQPTGLYSASGITNVTVTSLSYQNLVQLKHSVAKRYHNRPAFRWVFNQNVLAAIQNIIDLEGRPLFQPAIGSMPDRILNTPFSVEDGCPNSFVFIGDLAYYAWFDRRDMGMEASTEAGDAFEKHQIYLKTWMRADGKPSLPPTKPMARTRVLAGVSELI